MKANLRILTLLGLMAGSVAVAQTNPPAGATQPDAPAAVASEPAKAAEEPAPAATPPPAAPSGGLIPLIVMDDVPLTDAIKNLARQGGINFMLDPKVSSSFTGADGKAGVQPNVSIRWENISADQALGALLANYGLQLIDDPKTKISRITVKDPAAPEPLVTKVIQLKYASPSNIVASVQSILEKRSKVMVDIRTSQLVVQATEREMVEVDRLVERLDSATKQVLIEARLLEVEVKPSTYKGIDWSGTLANQQVTFGNNGFTRALGGSGLSAPISSGSSDAGLVGSPGVLMNLASGSAFNPAAAFLNADGVSATLSFLNSYAETKVISCPRTVTLDNEPALIEVGTMFPIINVTAGTANTTGGSQISYSNLTVRLEVTPRISANNLVNLKVHPQVLRLGDYVETVTAGEKSGAYKFATRRIDASVMVPSGNTLVMGGLISDTLNSANNKVPVLGDIPVLGYLFRADGKKREKSNLLVFLTPTIIGDNDFQPTSTEFLKTRVPTKDSIEDDWSAWDSGKPKDWKKKKTDKVTEVKEKPAKGMDESQFSEVPATSTK